MKNFLKGMLFSVVTVILFIAIMLFAFDVRDKKYFKDKGSIAEENKTYNFFYGVFGYHNREPIYEISTEEFDFFMYEIVATKESDPNEMVEYIYMLYVPKTEERKNYNDKYLRFYYEDNKFESIMMYRYMDFDMFNTYENNFLITKKYFGNKNFKQIAFVEEFDDKDEDILYREDFISPIPNFTMKDRLSDYLNTYNELPSTQLMEDNIYPRITHIAEGYTYILWIGFGVGIFVLLALFGGVYLKPPFQKAKIEPTPGMKKDRENYV